MNILMGYSEKRDGSMYLSADGFDPVNLENRRKYFERIGAGEMKIVAAGLVHGTRVATVGRDTPAYIPETDALVTAEPGILLTLTGADCFPLFFRDEEAGVVGLAHAGWRGIVSGIVPVTIGALVRLGAEPERLRLRMGPGICRRCFRVGEEVASAFSSVSGAVERDNDVIRVDLPAAIRRQAVLSGVPGSAIEGAPECTSCLPERYFSYRRDRPERLETQVGYIGIPKV